MRTFLIPLIIGFILLYFLDAAIDISHVSLEMFVRNIFHFFAGFVAMGIWIWHRYKLRFKSAVYTIFILLITYHVVDYMRNIDNLNLEILIHDTYVLLWGGVTGYFFLRTIKPKEN